MAKPCGIAIGDVLGEFDGASLGDARLNERLRRIVARAASDPSQSFPEQMASVADREALYRFLANPKVTLAGVLEGHVRQTRARMEGRSVVRVVHDTTVFRFLGDREGLGEIRGGAKGFLGHVALAVAADETREPLGVLGVHPYIHQDAVAHRGLTPRQRRAATCAKPRAARESARWEQMAHRVSATVPDGVTAVHVMDQEADDYDVLSALHAAGLHYVIRVDPTRRTAEAMRPMKEVLARQPGTLFRTVPVTPRSPKTASRTRGRYPARTERHATLQVRWATVHLKRSSHNDTALVTLTVQAVHVVEPAPPPGEVPIEWMLVTSEPVQTLEDATAMVDHYRARWLIEEYFKALKTGCAFEKRQLTSLPALLRALALFVPLAWRLLVLRHLGRAPQLHPVGDVLDRTQLILLRALLARRHYVLPHQPSMQDAMRGVAALGGHIKNNGAPGWIVLGRGLTRLLDTEVGWRLALETRCDQS
jgi:hypothetical protein